MFSGKKKESNLTKFKTLSNDKYKQLNLGNIIYCINYNLLQKNYIILGKL